MKLLALYNLKKRLLELAKKSYEHNIYTYTSFLSLAEQDVFYSLTNEIAGVSYKLFGGNIDCERQMLQFGSADILGYEEDFPLVCLLIEPVTKKFADDLNHRDFLGAIMNLGIERSTIGDIFIQGKSAYLFCTDKMAPFIVDNLDKVKHTNVRCSIVVSEMELPVKEPEPLNITVASERADGVIAKIYNLSRNQCVDLFRAKKIYINGRLNENNSYNLKSEDIVSVRGFGKFVYYGTSHKTKKGKLGVLAGIYR